MLSSTLPTIARATPLVARLGHAGPGERSGSCDLRCGGANPAAPFSSGEGGVSIRRSPQPQKRSPQSMEVIDCPFGDLPRADV